MKLKSLPKTCPVVNAKRSTTGVDRPREKLITKGAQNLKDLPCRELVLLRGEEL